MTTTTITLYAVIAACAQAIVSIFSYLTLVYKSKNDKSAKREQKIEKAENKLDDICDNGSIDDLINASKEIGKAKK